jgi:Fission yeast centromere protein N-terminal domain
MAFSAFSLTRTSSLPHKRLRSNHRHGITDAQRRDLRQYWLKAFKDQKPTQQQIQAWFSAKYHPISQSTVSNSLSQAYNYLDGDKRLNYPEKIRAREGKWPKLEAALH